MNAFVQDTSSSISSPASATNDMYEVKVSGDNKSYLCKHSDCGRIFRFKSEIVRHIATHGSERPFTCEFEGCGKSFKRQDALENHIRIHTKENPFVCEFDSCGKTFPTKASLRYHMLKHKDEKTYTCSHPGCGKAFLTLFQLKQHERADNLHKKIKISSEEALNKPERATTKSVSSPSDSQEKVAMDYSKPYKVEHIGESTIVKKVSPVESSLMTTVSTPTSVNSQSLVMVDEKAHPLFRENMMLKKRLDFTEKLLMKVLATNPTQKQQQPAVQQPSISQLAALLLRQKLSQQAK